jgi:PAS domain S-box-containing protein
MPSKAPTTEDIQLSPEPAGGNDVPQELAQEASQRALGVLRKRLQEAEDILRAIQEGEIDALAVLGTRGPRIHTLSGAEHPYRVLVETMGEGALTLALSGRVLFGNPAFARLIGISQEELVNLDLKSFVQPADLPLFEALLGRGAQAASKAEVGLLLNGVARPVLVTMTPLDADGTPCICAIVTDLREHKRNQELVAEGRLTNSILDQAGEAIIVCDHAGLVIRANRQAQSLCMANPLLRLLDASFPLFFPAAENAGASLNSAPVKVAEILEGRTYARREVILGQRGASGVRHLPMLLSAGPLRAADGAIIGCVVLLTDITERKQAEQVQIETLHREQQARAEAQAANQAKDIFLATLSHELRTPLSAVLGWVRLLQESPDPETRQQAVEVIERNAWAQAQLIDDILDISRIISGKIVLEMRALNLESIINAAVESVRPTADAKGISMSIAPSDETLWVRGDAARLQQVLWNLLSNATKFTPGGGFIRVESRSDEHSVFITITDTGQGITPAFLPFVFDRFSQADGSTSRRHGGLGLGLAIVRTLVEMHGGSVAVQSLGEGCGSTFTVQLPRATSSAAAFRESAVPTVTPEVAPQEKNGRLLAGLRLLVVDDKFDTLSFLQMALTRQGAQVEAASSTAEALKLLAQKLPDVLISDIAMPESDGYELLKRLRELEAAEKVKVGLPAIALTAFARSIDVENAMHAGFQRHLSKPVDITALIEAIAVLARSRPKPASF